MRQLIVISLFASCTAGLIAQSADLAQYQPLMKAGAGANGALRAAVTAKDAAAIKEQSAKAAEAFDGISKFWAAKQKADAVKFAEDARDAAKAVGTASDDAAQQAALGKLGATCMGCHAVYRNGRDFK